MCVFFFQMKSRNFEKVEKVGYEIGNLVHMFYLNWRRNFYLIGLRLIKLYCLENNNYFFPSVLLCSETGRNFFKAVTIIKLFLQVHTSTNQLEKFSFETTLPGLNLPYHS